MTTKQEKKLAEQSRKFCESFDIKSDSDLKFAVGACAEVKLAHEKLDTRAQEKWRPLDNEAKAIKKGYAPALGDLKGAEKAAKSAILAYKHALDARRDELQARLMRVEGDEYDAVLGELAACEMPEISGLSFRDSVSVDIVDERAAIKHFIDLGILDIFEINKSKLRKFLSASHGSNEKIPGVAHKHGHSVTITAGRVIGEK